MYFQTNCLKLLIAKPDGAKVWVNPDYIVKMERSPSGEYFISLLSGEVIEIDQALAARMAYFNMD